MDEQDLPSTIEAARRALVRRLERKVPGPGTITVQPTVAHKHNIVVYTCRRSNRGAVVNLWLRIDDDPEGLAERAIDELEATQLTALEPPDQ